MPRCNLVRSDPAKVQNMLIVERISGKLATKGMKGKELAAKTGIKPATYYNRMKAPETFRIDELRRIYKVLGITEDDPARNII